MITAKDIMAKLDEGLKMFGEYTYHDKGATEIMDVNIITLKLKELPNEDIITILKEVEKHHSDPHSFLEQVAMDLLNIPEGQDPKMDELGEDSFWREYF